MAKTPANQETGDRPAEPTGPKTETLKNLTATVAQRDQQIEEQQNTINVLHSTLESERDTAHNLNGFIAVLKSSLAAYQRQAE